MFYIYQRGRKGSFLLLSEREEGLCSISTVPEREEGLCSSSTREGGRALFFILQRERKGSVLHLPEKD